MNARDRNVHAEFAARCEEARQALKKHMEERGLFARDGWRVHEFIRQAIGRTELVMRPIHSTLDAPDDLECVCAIDEPGENISSDCK